MTEAVTFEIGDDHVGVVTLNRPDKHNAMNDDVFAGLRAAARDIAEHAAQGACRAVLVTGAGRGFSAGLDVHLFTPHLAATHGQPAAVDEAIARLQATFTAFEDLPVPTVAALHGVAIGAGCQLAAACHLRVAAVDLRMGLREARWALVPDLGATYRLPRLVGLSRAIDLAVSARDIDAHTALTWGLVDAVFDVDDFREQARAYAALLAGGPTVATGAVPRLMRESLAASRRDALAAERRAQAACLASADFTEAVAAAEDGRAPHFSGR